MPGFLCCLWGRLFAFCLFGGEGGGGLAWFQFLLFSPVHSHSLSVLFNQAIWLCKPFAGPNSPEGSTLWKINNKKKKKKNEKNDYGANHSKTKNCWGKTFSEIIVLPWFLAGLWCCSIIIVSYDNKKGNKFYNNFVIVWFNDFWNLLK